MNKRRLLIFGILAVVSLLVGGLFLSKERNNSDVAADQAGKEDVSSEISEEAFDATNKTLARHKITGVENLDGPYKKVTVSDGKVTFSFEVPDQWLTETRNSGEVEMNEEELREYFATNYDGDIKAEQVCNDQAFEYETGEVKTKNICFKPYSDYSGNDWDTLKEMPYEQLKEILDLKKREDSPVPNATVSLSNKIWYTDIGWDQIDFYLVDKKDGLRYIENSKKNLQEVLELQDPKFRDKRETKWKSIKINGHNAVVSVFPKEYFSDTDEWKVTKGGTGGSKYYIDLGDSMLIIWKEAYVEGEFEEGFRHILDTLRFHK